MLKKVISFLIVFVLLFLILTMTSCNKKETDPNNSVGNDLEQQSSNNKLPGDIIHLESCSIKFMETCITISQETGYNPIVYAPENYVEEEVIQDGITETVKSYKNVIANYYAIGCKYKVITTEEYNNIQEYQNRTGRQVLYPTVKFSDRPTLEKNKYDANIYYKVVDTKASVVRPVVDGDGNVIPNYWKYKEGTTSGLIAPYNSLRIEGEDGIVENGTTYYYAYGRNVDGGIEVRSLMYEYYLYLRDTSPDTTPPIDEYFAYFTLNLGR